MSDYPEPTRIHTPIPAEALKGLRAGHAVELSGTIYTARDAAHQRLVAAIRNDQPLPIPLAGQVIYYCGPAPARPGLPIGSCGPTTASRMDPYTPALLARGLAATIGKGNRTAEVRRALMQHGAVYFIAVGGAGALLASHVVEAEVVAYAELGPEAIYRLVVRDMPLLVAYDCHGGTVFAGEQPLQPGD